MLGLLWLALVWAAIQVGCRLLPRPLSASTSLTVSPFSIHLSTTAFNSLPARILRLTGGSFWRTDGRRWATAWDVGALVAVVGVLVAQVVLVWAAASALGAAWGVWTAKQAAQAALELAKHSSKLSKRALGGTVDPSVAGDGLLLHALVSFSPRTPSQLVPHSSSRLTSFAPCRSRASRRP